MIIDLINAKNEQGAVAFLDQEKAFIVVSFTTINLVFTKLNWPDRFYAVFQTTYYKNRARVKAIGTISKDFPVNSETRQGCPLSLLIYAANLYNMAVINHKYFQGHEMLFGGLSKSQLMLMTQ
jgi:hypothetical protein